MGFYLVKNAVDRDMQTGVGQILATTRLTKPLYMLGKTLSNFAVLAAMVVVMAIAAALLQLARREDMAIRVWQLLFPFLFIVIPVMTVVASVAILFEAIPLLRGGVGNVVYFFLWILAGLVAEAQALFGSSDLMGLHVVIPRLFAACGKTFSGCATSENFSMGFNFGSGKVWDLTTFRWEGVHWTPEIILGRLLWIGFGLGTALLAGVFFNRFDPAREPRKTRATSAVASPELEVKLTRPAASHIVLSSLSTAARKFRFGAMIAAELRLALKGLGLWWYVVALVLIIGGLVSPLAISRFWLIAAWIWPILVWSAMGTREARQGTGQLIFSTAHPLRRQLSACWLAGVMVAVVTGGGTALRLLLARDGANLTAWIVGALFIPTLALAFGVWSGTSKLFEVIYTLLWYVGPANQVAPVDYMGATGRSSRSGTPLLFLTLTIALAVFAWAGRKRQITT